MQLFAAGEMFVNGIQVTDDDGVEHVRPIIAYALDPEQPEGTVEPLQAWVLEKGLRVRKVVGTLTPPA